MAPRGTGSVQHQSMGFAVGTVVVGRVPWVAALVSWVLSRLAGDRGCQIVDIVDIVADKARTADQTSPEWCMSSH